MICYIMSVKSLLVSVFRQTKGKEKKEFPLKNLNLQGFLFPDGKYS